MIGRPDQRRIAAIAGAVFGRPVPVERVEHGASTLVYRIRAGDETFYLRVLPERGASLLPEAEAHARMRQLGAKVPQVIFVDPCDAVLGRSVMLTTEVPGRSIAASGELASAVLEAIVHQAGRDLARINSLAVDGWGWIERAGPRSATLAAQHRSWRAAVLEDWEADLAFLAGATISLAEASNLEQVIARYDAWLDTPQAWLAHGDLDATHIFHHNGRYSGIIDFGEIRGADRWYDAAHFHMRDGERLPMLLEPSLLHGYGDMRALPPQIDLRIRFTALLINVRALARSLGKRPLDRWTLHQLRVLRADLVALG